jgi:hypothetical protein
MGGNLPSSFDILYSVFCILYSLCRPVPLLRRVQLVQPVRSVRSLSMSPQTPPSPLVSPRTCRVGHPTNNPILNLKSEIHFLTPHPKPDSANSPLHASRLTLPAPSPHPHRKKQPIHIINPSFCAEGLWPHDMGGDYFVNLIYCVLQLWRFRRPSGHSVNSGHCSTQRLNTSSNDS